VLNGIKRVAILCLSKNKCENTKQRPISVGLDDHPTTCLELGYLTNNDSSKDKPIINI